jgi:hypothetical protein
MSVIDNTGTTNTTEPCQSEESSLKSEEPGLSFLRLAQLKETSFQWEEETHQVADAPVEVFDAFIAEVVEEIVNVDRTIWDIFDRWNIINACLEADVLLLTELPDGSLLLDIPEEVSASPSEIAGEHLDAKDISRSAT